jgi:hypothetical protein
MRSLISALAAAGLLMFTLSGYSADPAAPEGSPVMSKPDPSKPGRTIEESTVKSKPDPNRPGRTTEEEQEMNAGTAEEDQAVKAGGTSEEPGPTVEKK